MLDTDTTEAISEDNQGNWFWLTWWMFDEPGSPEVNLGSPHWIAMKLMATDIYNTANIAI